MRYRALPVIVVAASSLLLTPHSLPAARPTTRPATTAPTTAPSVRAVSPAEFQQLRNSHPDYLLLDVRTPEEFAAGHLDGATLMNIRSPDFADKVAALPRDKTYLVYCRTGLRSTLACQKLAATGLPAYNLQGGITAWRQSHLPTTQP
jgi:rhodanese-related sulfurtransferase